MAVATYLYDLVFVPAVILFAVRAILAELPAKHRKAAEVVAPAGEPNWMVRAVFSIPI